MSLTFGSLFSGIGGMDLGLEQAGWLCRWQVELDEWRRGILAKHWPEVERHADIHRVEASLLAPVDLIAGGDPCQANSLAGPGDTGVHDTTLADRFLEVVDEVRPRFVLRENPPSRADAPWTWQRFRSDLETLGYAVLPFRLRACCLGADHRRERVFLLGERVDADDAEAGRDSGRRKLCRAAEGRRAFGQPARSDQVGPREGTASDAHPQGQPQPQRALGEERGRGRHSNREAAADAQEWPRLLSGQRGSASQRQEAGLHRRRLETGWTDSTLSPVVVRDVHGLSERVDRAKRIAALGDSVAPPMARQIGEWLRAAA